MLAEEEEPGDEAIVREFLWTNHGCSISALYGDDGEMQCNNGLHRPLDFKRQPMPVLVRAILAARIEHAKAALAEDRAEKAERERDGGEEIEILRQRVKDLEGYHGTEHDRMQAQRVVIEEGGSALNRQDTDLFRFAVDMVLKLDRQNYAYGECLKRERALRTAPAEAALSRMREALEKIARRGCVFDAKGTWSQEVHSIASVALAAYDERGSKSD
jgi:hypothetical protein